MRLAIVTDGQGWYIRRIRVIEHDLERDEKVYRCDLPIGSRFDTLAQAVKVARMQFPKKKFARGK